METEKPKKLSDKNLSYILADTLDNGSNILHFLPKYNPFELAQGLWPLLSPTEFEPFRSYFAPNKKPTPILSLNDNMKQKLIKQGKFEAYGPSPTYNEFFEFIKEVSHGMRGGWGAFNIQRVERFYEANFSPQQDFNGEIYLKLTRRKRKHLKNLNFFKVMKR